MKILYQIGDLWYLKMFFGLILTIISPIQTSIVIILIMIILDTITGTICAIALKRFNSKNFKKSITKSLIYSTCILTVRLVEVGALYFTDSLFFTQTIIAFLVITEAISILENLIILGLPLPIKFLNIFYKQVRIDLLDDLVEQRYNENKELEDIDDILEYQIPVIKSDDLRKELQITISAWIRITKNLISYFDSTKIVDNELIYYKVISIINVGIEDIKQDIAAKNSNFKQKCSVRELEKVRLERLLFDVKNICFDIKSNNNKKEEIIKTITIFLYQLVLEVQKHEEQVCII